MKVSGRVAIVTGGGSGIGAAIGAALVRNGARVLLADLDATAVQAVADGLNADSPAPVAAAVAGDVAETAVIADLIARAERDFGPVDLYFANAGITGAVGLEAGEADWARSIDVNLMAHVRAAQLLVPEWVRRGGGYFVSTASAAGLLTQVGSATYSVTKHAAVGFAEWLAISYGEQGVRVSCLCPMGVSTKLLYAGQDSADPRARLASRAVTTAGEVLEPAHVADVVLEAIDEERFLILPHPAVLDMYRHKGEDYDRWLNGMRRFQQSIYHADR